jgi:hypothetical protein
MLLVRRNAVSRTLADVGDILRTIREHEHGEPKPDGQPKPVDIVATPEWRAARAQIVAELKA